MDTWESRSDRLKRVRSEIERLEVQLSQVKRGSQPYALLYTAREALIWALDGAGKQSPRDAIVAWSQPNMRGEING